MSSDELLTEAEQLTRILNMWSLYSRRSENITQISSAAREGLLDPVSSAYRASAYLISRTLGYIVHCIA